MNSSVELKEEITFDEFKAWMNGLLRGTGKSCPGAEDWRAIYKMMDKVVPDQVEVPQYQPQFVPYTQPVEWIEPFKVTDPIPNPVYVGDTIPNPWEVTCNTDGNASLYSGYTNTAYGTPVLTSSAPMQTAGDASITIAAGALATSTIAPSIQPYEESESVKQLFEDLEEVRKEVYALTGITGKE